MALWGNNDAVGSGGTVALDYSTGVVTGTGTTFGQTGANKKEMLSVLVSVVVHTWVIAVIISIAFDHLLYNRIHNGSEWCKLLQEPPSPYLNFLSLPSWIRLTLRPTQTQTLWSMV